MSTSTSAPSNLAASASFSLVNSSLIAELSFSISAGSLSGCLAPQAIVAQQASNAPFSFVPMTSSVSILPCSDSTLSKLEASVKTRDVERREQRNIAAYVNEISTGLGIFSSELAASTSTTVSGFSFVDIPPTYASESLTPLSLSSSVRGAPEASTTAKRKPKFIQVTSRFNLNKFKPKLPPRAVIIERKSKDETNLDLLTEWENLDSSVSDSSESCLEMARNDVENDSDSGWVDVVLSLPSESPLVNVYPLPSIAEEPSHRFWHLRMPVNTKGTEDKEIHGRDGRGFKAVEEEREQLESRNRNQKSVGSHDEDEIAEITEKKGLEVEDSEHGVAEPAEGELELEMKFTMNSPDVSHRDLLALVIIPEDAEVADFDGGQTAPASNGRGGNCRLELVEDDDEKSEHMEEEEEEEEDKIVVWSPAATNFLPFCIEDHRGLDVQEDEYDDDEGRSKSYM